MKKQFKAKVNENNLVRITDLVNNKTKVYNVLNFIQGQKHYRVETTEYPAWLLNDIDNQMKKYKYIND